MKPVAFAYQAPGSVSDAVALLAGDREAVALAGNLCRCTGYEGIVAAVQAAAGDQRSED